MVSGHHTMRNCRTALGRLRATAVKHRIHANQSDLTFRSPLPNKEYILFLICAMFTKIDHTATHEQIPATILKDNSYIKYTFFKKKLRKPLEIKAIQKYIRIKDPQISDY